MSQGTRIPPELQSWQVFFCTGQVNKLISVMYFFSCLLYPLIGRSSGESGNVYALWHVGTKSETWIQKQYSPECLLIIWPGVGEMHGNLVWLPVLVCPNT